MTRRASTLVAIARHLADHHGASPDVRLLARLTRTTLPAVYKAINLLRRERLITYDALSTLRIRLTAAGEALVAELTKPKQIIPDLIPVIRCTCGTSRVGCGARVVVTLRALRGAA